MNWESIKGQWKQLKGKVKQEWGMLADSDFTRFDGKREETIGRLQQRYGYSKVQAEREADEFLSETRP